MKKEVLARYLLQKQRCLTPPGDETLEIGGGKRRLAHPKKTTLRTGDCCASKSREKKPPICWVERSCEKHKVERTCGKSAKAVAKLLTTIRWRRLETTEKNMISARTPMLECATFFVLAETTPFCPVADSLLESCTVPDGIWSLTMARARTVSDDRPEGKCHEQRCELQYIMV